MSSLPSELEALVEDVLASARLEESVRADVRADLRQHFRDGLARGKSVEELAKRFGEPEVVGPLLARAPVPTSELRGSTRGDGLISSLVGDLRHAVRSIFRAPTLAITGTIVLALGVGANTVVFSVLNELLLRPLPVEDPSGLVDVWADIQGANSFSGVSWQDYATYRAENEVLRELVAFSGRRFELERDGPIVVSTFITPGYFEMLGLDASAGAVAFPREGRLNDDPVAILAHGFWQNAFAADPTIVGRTIRLGDEPVTVIGVGPEGFSGHFIGFPSDVWLPFTAAPRMIAGFDPDDRTQQSLEMIGRLREGVSVQAAGEALNVIAGELERIYPETNRGHRLGVTASTGLDHSLQGGVTAFLLILTAISALVLIVACLNVGSVMLVRAMSRERELAVRVALGAGRGRLLRMMLTESTLLALLGAGAGVLLAWRLNDGLTEALSRSAPGLGLDLPIDGRVLLLTAIAALGASLVTTIAPSLFVLGRSPAGVLRSRGGPTAAGDRLRTLLVVGQVAVSVVLVIASGLFARALAEGSRTDPGFDADRIGAFSFLPATESAIDAAQVERDLLVALMDLPGVEAVSVGSTPPLGVARSPVALEVSGVLPPPGAEHHVIDARSVGPAYLEALGIPLLEGRDFTEFDEGSADRVAIVSAAFRDRFWPGEEVVGRSLAVASETVTVIGLAADARYIVQDDTPDPLIYLSRPEGSANARLVVVRVAEPLALAADVDRIVTQITPAHSRIQFRTARRVLDDALLPQRMAVLIVGAMGLAALFVAAVGLYGLIQFQVARSTHELGVRLALGGGPAHVALVVVRKGFLLATIGTAVGVGLALLAAPGLGTFLAGVSPSDPLTYGTVILCFGLVAAFASWLPARRALRIEPTEALRGE